MIDTRAVGQELQDQVLGAARKGRERVTSTVKTVTATAQHIRPQLANLRPHLTVWTLPTPTQLREKTPGLVAKLPTPEQLRAGAHEFAGHARTVQRIVLDQVRTVAVPLAHQAAARLAKVGTPSAHPQATTRVREVTVKSAAPAKDEEAATSKAAHAAGGQQKAKPKAKPTAK